MKNLILSNFLLPFSFFSFAAEANPCPELKAKYICSYMTDVTQDDLSTKKEEINLPLEIVSINKGNKTYFQVNSHKTILVDGKGNTTGQYMGDTDAQFEYTCKENGFSAKTLHPIQLGSQVEIDYSIESNKTLKYYTNTQVVISTEDNKPIFMSAPDFSYTVECVRVE